jgi:hypothetical protein
MIVASATKGKLQVVAAASKLAHQVVPTTSNLRLEVAPASPKLVHPFGARTSVLHGRTRCLESGSEAQEAPAMMVIRTLTETWRAVGREAGRAGAPHSTRSKVEVEVDAGRSIGAL